MCGGSGASDSKSAVSAENVLLEKILWCNAEMTTPSGHGSSSPIYKIGTSVRSFQTPAKFLLHTEMEK